MLNIDFTFIWLCFQISFQVCKYVIKLSGSKKKKKPSMVQLCLPPLFEKHSFVENEHLQLNNLFMQSKYLLFCIGRITVVIEMRHFNSSV